MFWRCHPYLNSKSTEARVSSRRRWRRQRQLCSETLWRWLRNSRRIWSYVLVEDSVRPWCDWIPSLLWHSSSVSSSWRTWVSGKLCIRRKGRCLKRDHNLTSSFQLLAHEPHHLEEAMVRAWPSWWVPYRYHKSSTSLHPRDCCVWVLSRGSSRRTTSRSSFRCLPFGRRWWCMMIAFRGIWWSPSDTSKRNLSCQEYLGYESFRITRSWLEEVEDPLMAPDSQSVAPVDDHNSCVVVLEEILKTLVEVHDRRWGFFGSCRLLLLLTPHFLLLLLLLLPLLFALFARVQVQIWRSKSNYAGYFFSYIRHEYYGIHVQDPEKSTLWSSSV